VKKNMTFVYFHVEVIRVIDGDTVELNIDMGNNTFWRDKFRLAGINAPEKHKTDKAAADAATAFLANALQEENLFVNTYGKDKYGRRLCRFFTVNGNVNLRMIEAGHAVAYDGGKR
jgi:micrococcal nuclease